MSSLRLLIISHCLSRFIRHQLIQTAGLPQPGDEIRALGEKRYQAFLDSIARLMAKNADSDNESARPPGGPA